MKPWQDRVILENDELSVKINKLCDFMFDGRAAELCLFDCDLLIVQLQAMRAYQQVLGDRIARFNEDYHD